MLGDCERLTDYFGKGSIDIVVDIESSFYYPDKEAFLRGVHSILKDDGLFIFAFYTLYTKLPEMYTSIRTYFEIVKEEDITDNAIESLRLDT